MWEPSQYGETREFICNSDRYEADRCTTYTTVEDGLYRVIIHNIDYPEAHPPLLCLISKEQSDLLIDALTDRSSE